MKNVNIFASFFEENREFKEHRNSLGRGVKSGSHAKLRFYSCQRWESKHGVGRDYKCIVEL